MKKNTLGWNDYAMTLEDVGREMGVTASRVQQIEKKALAKVSDRMKLLGMRFDYVVLDQFGECSR